MSCNCIFFAFVTVMLFLLPQFSTCINTCATANCDKSQKCVNGKCVPIKRDCPLNEEFRECGSDCEGKCPDHDQHQRPSNKIVSVGVCDGACIPNVCQCQRGYVRHPSGFCIIPSDCRPHNLGRRSVRK
uniref:TIL domain-containing protein n=1 Tax=Plectus sambesii TaxID=2011161 RepID=A0A914UKN4_9BILA